MLLGKYGADPNRADKDGYTPLHVACSNFHVDQITTLLKYGADPNRTSKEGITPVVDLVASACLGWTGRTTREEGGKFVKASIRALVEGAEKQCASCFHPLVEEHSDKDGAQPCRCEAGKKKANKLDLNLLPEYEEDTVLDVLLEEKWFNEDVDFKAYLVEKGAKTADEVNEQLVKYTK